ncbi:hypothetical protein O6H91_13G036000 [Diphasiastrum complanatum]|uniref:Uncharacterized protein n=1 Tax=Diphasiastrum complanatum TaxID=34168 RepID=A0ACC2BTS2_DIPCM|nr:hypothetical protein O6H91_13G036000 [Diphasiastrum complanatum]
MRPFKLLSIVAKEADCANLLQNFKRRNQFSCHKHQPSWIPFVGTLSAELHHFIFSHVSSYASPSQKRGFIPGSLILRDVTCWPCNKAEFPFPIHTYGLSNSRPGKRLVSFERSLLARSMHHAGCAGWLMACRNIAVHRQIEKDAGSNHGERSKLLGDKLVLQGLMFHGHHGVYDEEKKLGQKFRVDVDVWLDLRKAGATDQLEYSVSYAEIYRIIKKILEGPPHALLESVATAIAFDIFKNFPAITDVRVKVGKPHVAVEGVVDYLGVEIFRSNAV